MQLLFYSMGKHLTLCMLGNFACFLSFAGFKFFFKKTLKPINVAKSLDPDQTQHNVGPDQGPNCLQRLLVSAEDKKLSSLVQSTAVDLIVFSILSFLYLSLLIGKNPKHFTRTTTASAKKKGLSVTLGHVLTLLHVTSRGVDQPAHLHSLISAFVSHFLAKPATC